MSRSAHEYLQHILDETRYLAKVSAGLDQSTFLADETLKRAVARSIEIIGEAVKPQLHTAVLEIIDREFPSS
ncbi:MAG: DUF86 domain-containing protein [Roseiflexaceae bacterium]|nr:DUF86 domain-containing protein [Roseiflexaceae bacterium]